MSVYRAAGSEQRARAEYDAFGPWIAQIRENDDIPPVFAAFPLDLENDYALKFPRSEARRDLVAGMDLYDQVLVVRPADLVVLARTGAGSAGSLGLGSSGSADSGFTVSTIGYSAIAAIIDSVDLLDGRLEILSIDGVRHTIAYNGSSRGIVTRVVDRIRSLSLAATPSRVGWRGLPAPEPGTPARLDMDDLGRKDAGLVSFFAEVSRAEASRGDVAVLIAAGGRSTAISSGTSLARLVHLVRPAIVQGAILLASGSEMQVLSRRLQIQRGGPPATSLSRSVLIVPRVTAVELTGHPAYEGVSIVTVRLGEAQVDFTVPTGSPLERGLLALTP